MKPVRLLVRYLPATLLGILLAAVLSLAIFGVSGYATGFEAPEREEEGKGVNDPYFINLYKVEF